MMQIRTHKFTNAPMFFCTKIIIFNHYNCVTHLQLFSGKTVEINNTDAEGRLVLGDGVAHASKMLSPVPDLIVDMATLTGAQLVTTGKRHAAVQSNSADAEARAVAAGMRSGDLTFPILYCPEFHRAEFASKVADMKNSVKDRMNAQASCAGAFVGEHLDAAYEGSWLHVDMAGPATREERGTGYGTGLLLSLADVA
jgi:probable aminopeptidase NPEPL1